MSDGFFTFYLFRGVAVDINLRTQELRLKLVREPTKMNKNPKQHMILDPWNIDTFIREYKLLYPNEYENEFNFLRFVEFNLKNFPNHKRYKINRLNYYNKRKLSMFLSALERAVPKKVWIPKQKNNNKIWVPKQRPVIHELNDDTYTPTGLPTNTPTYIPSLQPTESPSNNPSNVASLQPTISPSTNDSDFYFITTHDIGNISSAHGGSSAHRNNFITTESGPQNNGIMHDNVGTIMIIILAVSIILVISTFVIFINKVRSYIFIFFIYWNNYF